MKICFLSALYTDEVFGGGVKTYLYYLSRELFKQGHRVTIIASGKPREYYENGVQIIKVGEIEIFENKKQLFSPEFLYKRLRYMIKATQTIQKFHFDIVEVPEGGFEHLFLVFNKPCPVITRFHGNVNYTKFPTARICMVNWLEGLAVRKSDAFSSPIVAYSVILSKEYSVSLDAIRIIPYGINLDFLLDHIKIDIRSKYNLKDKKIILFTGELNFRKGIKLLCQLAERFLEKQDVIFVMIGGDTTYSNSLRFSSNILWLKLLSKDELFSFYRECDIFIMPSIFENMSYSILEAMVFGKPILGANVGGTPELIVNNYNGILFNTGDIEDLVIKLKYLLSSPALLASMEEGSRELSKKYEINKIAKTTIKFYEETISRNSILKIKAQTFLK